MTLAVVKPGTQVLFLHIFHGLMNPLGSPGSSLTLFPKGRRGKDYVEKQERQKSSSFGFYAESLFPTWWKRNISPIILPPMLEKHFQERAINSFYSVYKMK